MTITAPSSTVALVPGERFFLKAIALDPAVAVARQVELALEESSPFPLTQLFHGYVTSPDRRTALAYAAYRRRFTTEELTEWPAAVAVLPDFVGLLGPAPARTMIVVQVHPGGVNAVAWDGQAGLPVAVLCRAFAEPADSRVAEIAAELRSRAGLDEVEVRRLDGPVGVGVDENGAAAFRIAGEETMSLSPASLGEADVRDKSFLQEKGREDRRRRGWGRALGAAAALVAIALLAELAAMGLGLWTERLRRVVAGQAEEVRRIETAQTLATRIEDLAARQEKPLEWLSLVSTLRPRSIQFTRVASNNDQSLTIDAQTPDASAVGAYEAALRGRAELEQVEMRDLRSREGMTSFVLFVRFRPVVGETLGAQP